MVSSLLCVGRDRWSARAHIRTSASRTQFFVSVHMIDLVVKCLLCARSILIRTRNETSNPFVSLSTLCSLPGFRLCLVNGFVIDRVENAPKMPLLASRINMFGHERVSVCSTHNTMHYMKWQRCSSHCRCLPLSLAATWLGAEKIKHSIGWNFEIENVSWMPTKEVIHLPTIEKRMERDRERERARERWR